MKSETLFFLLGLFVLIAVEKTMAWELDTPPTPLITCYVENYDGSRRFIGGTCGVWKSEDFGQTWVPINDLINPFNPQTEFPGDLVVVDSLADTVIMRSFSSGFTTVTYDGGQTWRRVSPGPGSGEPPHLLISKGEGVPWLIATTDGLQRSFNHGTSWQNVVVNEYTNSAPLYQSQFDPGRFYFVPDLIRYPETDEEHGGLLVSNDSGRTWQSLMLDQHLLESAEFVFLHSMCELSNGTLIVSSVGTYPDYLLDDGLLFYSTDMGETWTRPAGELPANFDSENLVEARHYPGTLLIGASLLRGVYRSTDYGASWSKVDFGTPLVRENCDFMFSNPFSGDLVIGMSGSNVFRSVVGGMTWGAEHLPLVGGPTTNAVLENSIIATSWERDQVWIRDSETQSWRKLDLPVSLDTANYYLGVQHISGNEWAALVRQNPLTGDYFDGLMRVMRSHDNGHTWELMERAPFTWTYEVPFTWEGESGITTYLLSRYGDSLHFSSDGMHTWQSSTMGGRHGFNVLANDQNVVVFRDVTDPDFVIGTPGGDNWYDTGFTRPSEWAFITTTRVVLLDNMLYVLPYVETPSSKLYRWDGIEWDSSVVLPATKFSALAGIAEENRHILFAINEYGENSFLSIDSGRTWSRVESEFPNSANMYDIYSAMLTREDRDIYAWTVTGLGTFKWNLTDVIAPVSEKPELLAQDISITVYPNPTNGVVRISLTLPAVTEVEISMFDVLGRRVANVFSGKTASTTLTYSVPSEQSSGIYFVRVSANDEYRMQKVAYLK